MVRPSRRTFLKGIGVASAGTLLGSTALGQESPSVGTDWPTAFGTDGRTSFTTGSGPSGPYATNDFGIDTDLNPDEALLQEDPLPLVVDDGTLFVTTNYFYSETNGEVAAFDASGDGLIWYKSEGIGLVAGAPTITDDTLYVATSSFGAIVEDELGSEPNKGGFKAIDRETGETKWTYKREEQWLGSPVVHDGTIYALGGDGLYALNPDGTEKWMIEANGRTLARVGETLYTGDWWGLTAFDMDGNEKWSAEIPEDANGEGVVATEEFLYVTNQELYFEETTNNSIWAFSTVDGSLAWEAHVSADYEWSTPTRVSDVAVGNGVLYLTSYDVNNDVGAVHALDAQTGEEQWQFTTAAKLVSRPSVTQETVYAGGYFQSKYTAGESAYTNVAAQYALDVTSGEERWNYAFHDARSGLKAFTTTPVDDRLYVQVSTKGMPIDRERGFVRVLKSSEAKPGDMHQLADDTPTKPELPKPDAAIASQPPNAENIDFDSGAVVTLDGSESTSENGDITSYQWDIDADSEFEKTGETIEVELDYCGVLEVTLRVTDEAGQTTTEKIKLSTV
ncbi:PQQ-binding-like beta-propeller repeat protein [Haladaptatus sp. DYSN1]|uniref:outer membrane protein assembly factor BamB family protein n=1 Tax=unclassified Haladaptatus TaxID=2622732 RepID=UPI002406B7F7|nr:PQQ-binding-like beta-propeller repeat protein [Haladaptatus sp. DYSN1]